MEKKRKEKETKEYQNFLINPFNLILVAILFTITPVKYQQGIDFSVG